MLEWRRSFGSSPESLASVVRYRQASSLGWSGSLNFGPVYLASFPEINPMVLRQPGKAITTGEESTKIDV